MISLLALDLKVPENTLVDMHQYGEQGESYSMSLIYCRPRTRLSQSQRA